MEYLWVVILSAGSGIWRYGEDGTEQFTYVLKEIMSIFRGGISKPFPKLCARVASSNRDGGRDGWWYGRPVVGGGWRTSQAGVTIIVKWLVAGRRRFAVVVVVVVEREAAVRNS